MTRTMATTIQVVMLKAITGKTFIEHAKGHRLHHLYFWVLADECGMLKDVLNILSPEVSGDADRVSGNTALTQKAR
jgi:hypothetical protein